MNEETIDRFEGKDRGHIVGPDGRTCEFCKADLVGERAQPYKPGEAVCVIGRDPCTSYRVAQLPPGTACSITIPERRVVAGPRGRAVGAVEHAEFRRRQARRQQEPAA